MSCFNFLQLNNNKYLICIEHDIQIYNHGKVLIFRLFQIECKFANFIDYKLEAVVSHLFALINLIFQHRIYHVHKQKPYVTIQLHVDARVIMCRACSAMSKKKNTKHDVKWHHKSQLVGLGKRRTRRGKRNQTTCQHAVQRSLARRDAIVAYLRVLRYRVS